MRQTAFAIALTASIALATPALAAGSKVSSPAALAKQAEKLKPGDWVWAGDISSKGPVLVYVDLDRQRATVYRNGIRIGVTTISSGKPGHETPTGVFTILQKRKEHYSSTYNNAPMPNMQRLTWKGVALHAGNLPGYPASHGCVRLPLKFSEILFGTTSMGGTVVIAGSRGQPFKPACTFPCQCAAPAIPDHTCLARTRMRQNRAQVGQCLLKGNPGTQGFALFHIRRRVAQRHAALGPVEQGGRQHMKPRLGEILANRADMMVYAKDFLQHHQCRVQPRLTGLPDFKTVAISRLECYPVSHKNAPFLPGLP